LEATYPGNSGQGAKIPGLTYGGNSGLGAEFLAPWKFSFLKIPAKNFGPLLQGAPQLGRKDIAKICRAGNSRISGP
jgi:hypothetical protein